jgi:hypothetical protein
MKNIVSALSVLALSSIALSSNALGQAATINGTLDAAYPAAAWLQSLNTTFGDNVNELNSVHAMTNTVGTPVVNLFIGGNLNNNVDRFEFFISSGASGQSGISGLPVSNLNGLRFDAPFAATHYITVNRSGGSMFLDVATFNGSSWSAMAFAGSWNGTTWTPAGASGITAAYDGSNTGGVTGGTGAGSGAGVTAGLEFALPLAWLGVTPSQQFHLAGFITNTNRTIASNQWLGSLPPTFGNVPQNADTTAYAGNQWVLIPTPGSAALLSIGLLASARRRRA